MCQRVKEGYCNDPVVRRVFNIQCPDLVESGPDHMLRAEDSNFVSLAGPRHGRETGKGDALLSYPDSAACSVSSFMGPF